MTREHLIAAFKELGVPDPESWADSQLREGINQLSRAKALSMLWAGVVSENDTAFLDTYSRTKPNPASPATMFGLILARAQALGMHPRELLYLIRYAQSEMVYHICDVSDQSGGGSRPYDGIRLCDTDENDQVIDLPDCLHESVLELDPNELRPSPELMEILKKDPRLHGGSERPDK